MAILKNILEKLKVTFSWSGNTKKILKAEKSLQLSQETNGVMNVTNITNNITVENLQSLASSDNPDLLLKNTGNRFLSEQTLKQRNWLQAVNDANLMEIKNPKSLEKDWYLRWSEIAEKTSKDDLRLLVSKILNGKIKNSNSFSYRTLDFVKNITTDELNLFKKVAIFFTINKRIYIPKDNANNGFFDITYGELMKLIELGLIQPSITTITKIKDMKKGEVLPLIFQLFKKLISLPAKSDFSVNLPILVLSDPGYDIASLLELDKKDWERFYKYIDELVEFLKTKGFEKNMMKMENNNR